MSLTTTAGRRSKASRLKQCQLRVCQLVLTSINSIKLSFSSAYKSRLFFFSSDSSRKVALWLSLAQISDQTQRKLTRSSQRLRQNSSWACSFSFLPLVVYPMNPQGLIRTKSWNQRKSCVWTKQDFSSFKFISRRYLLLHWRIVGDLQSDVQIQVECRMPEEFQVEIVRAATVSVCSARALGCNASVVLFFEFHQTGPIKALPTKQRKTNLSKMWARMVLCALVEDMLLMMVLYYLAGRTMK